MKRKEEKDPGKLMKNTKLVIAFIIACLFSSAYPQAGKKIEIQRPLAGCKTLFYSVVWKGPGRQNVIFELSTDGGNTWKGESFLNSYTLDSLNYAFWNVSGINSDLCRIRLTELGNPSNADSTRGVFTMYTEKYDSIDVNQILMYAANNGAVNNPRTQAGGLYWPKFPDTPNIAVFQDGLLYAGKVNGEIRANGNYFRQGLVPGVIDENGNSSDPRNPLFKIWKIKKGWESLPAGQLRNSLEHDYLNWPSEIGAPFIDIDHDGKFTKGVDKPKFLGDEVLFYAANDMDTVTVKDQFCSKPIGLEQQVTIFAYDKQNELKDVILKKYRLINKGKNIINDMYLSYWTDDDLGWSEDDFVGCDTLLDLGYTYNSKNHDIVYGDAPPAAGHMFLQGPVVPSQKDSARIGYTWRKGFRNLKMTSFAPLFKNVLSFPDNLPNGIYRASLEAFNIMRGLTNSGNDVIDPLTNKPTVFPLSGDPEKGTGWYEGKGWPNGLPAFGRWLMINSGPFTMAPGDTQEVVIAIIMAKGTDYLNSVTQLKNKAGFVRSFYNNEFLTSAENKKTAILNEFRLEQNYPNPFNPSTSISYSIPDRSLVELKVYDMLGREVAVLINKEQNAGEYKVMFNASSLPGGIYIYSLQAGDYRAGKKLMYLK